MVKWDTNVYKYDENTEKIIGCSVTIYSDTGDVIDTIEIADADKLHELEEALQNIDSTYIQLNQLKTILKNIAGETEINATTLNGLNGSTWVTIQQLENMSFNPKPHASTTQTYGIGTDNNYGHVKIIDNCQKTQFVSGEALSAHQGNALIQKIATNENKINSNINRISTLEQKIENIPTKSDYRKITIARLRNGAYEGDEHLTLDLDVNFHDHVYARVVDSNNSPISSEDVVFEINNQLYKKTTDKNGLCDLNINLPSGKYVVTAITHNTSGRSLAHEHKVILVNTSW